MALAGAAVGIGLLCKGLVAVALPLGAIGAYLVVSGDWRSGESWQRLGLPGAVAAATLVAAPWHVLSIARHPPYFEFGLDSGPGQYHGFFWRYFINEHVLRFLGLRHPVDYDRVPLLWFWAGHLAWLFPWSGLIPAVRELRFRDEGRASRARMLMLCCCGFTLLFFSASTSQEYYTLPAYAPAVLLLASAAAALPHRFRSACRVAGGVYAAALVTGIAVLVAGRNATAAGDISNALVSNPEAYTLALGHFSDLTLDAFAYLRGPLALAVAACGIGALGGCLLTYRRAAATLACATLLVLHAAHWAMAAFDPYLSSRHLADAYLRAPPGQIILDHEYYAFSSVAFYTNRPVLLLNGRKNNIEYGSNAPGAPDVFLDDSDLVHLWDAGHPVYLATYGEDRVRFEALLGAERVHPVAESGGKILLSNRR